MIGNPIIRVPARPEPIEVPAAHAALIVVDMQNGYASPGGYRDLSGRDIAPAKRVIANTLRLTQAMRLAGMPVVFLQNGWDPELKTAGGPDSPNWHKSNPLKLMRARPELTGKILTRGSWDYDFVEELTPGPGDFVVQKSRYSGFCGTELDNVLRARNTRYLVFAGIASNVCVESTIRDAYHREYFCILVEDATQQSGPSFVQDAVIYSMENFLGWVTSTDAFCAALDGRASTE
jgi:ureidoacrylate peracid hydrolase